MRIFALTELVVTDAINLREIAIASRVYGFPPTEMAGITGCNVDGV